MRKLGSGPEYRRRRNGARGRHRYSRTEFGTRGRHATGGYGDTTRGYNNSTGNHGHASGKHSDATGRYGNTARRKWNSGNGNVSERHESWNEPAKSFEPWSDHTGRKSE